MKNSDEMVKSLFKRREQYIDEQNRKKMQRNKQLKYCLIITCILTIVSLLHLTITPSIYPDNSNLKINKTHGVTLCNLDVRSTYYANLSDSEKKEMVNTFQSLTGLDYEAFLANVPKIYSEIFFYCHEAPEAPIDFNNKTYVLHDYIFHFSTADQTHITIKICPFETPLRDIVYTPVTSVKSEINGVEITVYSIGKQLKHLIIEFIFNDSYYEVETYDISITEVEKLLDIILQCNIS